MKSKTIFTGLVAIGLLAGCSEKPEVKEPSPATLPSVFSAAMPEGKTVPIPEARKELAGNEVIIEGKIMGVDHPFVANRAVFVLGDDATITSCDEQEGDGCKTPWDACCDPADVRIKGTATIQILAEDGSVLAQGLKDVGGLKALSRVRVAGTVDANSSVDSMIVNAKAIAILP